MNRTSPFRITALSALAALLALPACGGDGSTSTSEASSSGGQGGAGGGKATSSSSSSSGEICPAAGDACTSCESTACPKEYCDCYHSTECVLLAQCTAKCNPTDNACNQPCWTAHPSAISQGALLVNCAGTVCSAGCPGYSPIGACLICLYTSCSSEMNACISNPDCTALLVCLTACTTPMCETNCYQQHPNGAGPAGPVANCLQADCAAPCAK